MLGLLPRWTFFAPNPATRDLHLVVRDRLLSGELTEWEELEYAPERGNFDAVWHPGKRSRKAVTDAAQSLKMIVRRNVMWVPGSLPYLVILNMCVHGVPRKLQATARQFALVETSGRVDRQLWIVYSSQFHPL